MKTKGFLIFLLILLSQAVEAQVLIGPTFGINYSYVKFGDKDYNAIFKPNPVLGYHAGVNLSFRVRKRFFLHTSFIYSTKGKNMTTSDDHDPNFRNKVIYKYLELPLVYTVEFKTQLKRGKEFKWYFGLGPNLSYWLGGKGTFFNEEYGDQAIPEEKNYKIAFYKSRSDVKNNEMGVENPTRIQLGVNVSAGVVFEPIHDRKFMLTARYEFGHSYLSRTSSGEFSDVLYKENLQTKNRGFRFALAYLIDLRTDQRKRGKTTFKHKK